ncbi:hypothetical protein Droror1_Dr00012295 [Drosera rotundifolia]
MVEPMKLSMRMSSPEAKLREESGGSTGHGVPVEVHQEEKVYVPELIFVHLLTSSNYDFSVKKTTGERNGYGAKLTNIFSTEFVIETADGKRQRKYKQCCPIVRPLLRLIWVGRPFFGDQSVNTMYITRVWKIGLELEKNEFERGNITECIRKLLVEKDGQEMRDRAALLKAKVMASLKEGSSQKYLDQLADHISSV